MYHIEDEIVQDVLDTTDVMIAQYGIPNEEGAIMSEQDALALHRVLRLQETVPCEHAGAVLSNVRIEGDRDRGAVYATVVFL